jgi:large conductance mechanosensitive channel
MLTGFKKFILRGNVVDLAVGVVVGAAFSGFVTALVKDLITPLVAAIFKAPDFSALSFTVNNSKFLYGDFLNALISFLIVSFSVYFFVVLPVNALIARVRKEPLVEPTTKKCPECASDIPVSAKRCPFCTSILIKNE